MRRYSVYVLAGVLLVLASCHKDPGTFSIRFQPKFGSADLRLDSTYPTPDGKYVNITNLGLYLSHIRLMRYDNTEVEVDSAVLFLYANSPFTINLPAINGSYKAIKFEIGLDSAQNRIVPGPPLPEGSVYFNNALWWGAPQYHLFTQMEGYAGTTPSLGSVFFYHVGTDSMSRTATVAKAFSISDGQATTLMLNADIQQVFYGPNAINVITQPQTHTTDYPDRARIVSDAFSNLFSIQ